MTAPTAGETSGPLATDRDGSLLRVVLDRPAVHNALSGELLGALGATLRAAAGDTSVRVVVLSGAGDRAFSAGADLDELAGLSAGAARTVLRRGQDVLWQLEHMPVPVIAAVDGLALGGGFELALACSFVVASTSARFGFPETGLGLMPGYGGTQRLPRLVGRGPALHLMLTGARMGAERAHQLGLVAVPPMSPAELPGAADEIARRVASRGPRANRQVLEAVSAGSEASLDTALRLESTLAALAIASPEGAEGVSAFRERRDPTFEDSE
ncbi:MAG: enoyl-CoA hydratase/isomerase family protein [Streptosporangiaceae bacterium]